MPPFFSIIIPVYNVAPYLRECLDSVLTQTFQEWEAVCVDDGSTDGSGAVLDEYQRQDDRFRIYHRQNAGVSAARNYGLQKIRGEYFIFLDADDVIAPWSLAMIQQVANNNAADGVISNVLWHRFTNCDQLDALKDRFGKMYESNCFTCRKVIDKVELIAGKECAVGCVCGRAFRSARFNSLHFPEGVAIMEDLRTWADSLCVDANWVEINLPFYYYRDRSGSATKKLSHRAIHEIFDGNAHVLRLLKFRLSATEMQLLDYWNKNRILFWLVWRKIVKDWTKINREERRQFIDEVGRCLVSKVIRKHWSFLLIKLSEKISCARFISYPVYIIDRVWVGITRRLGILP